MTTRQSSLQCRTLIIAEGLRDCQMPDSVTVMCHYPTVLLCDCLSRSAAPNPGCHPGPEIRAVADITPESQAGVGSFLETITILSSSVSSVSRNLACLINQFS